MAESAQYATWISENEELKGTEMFGEVQRAYEAARLGEEKKNAPAGLFAQTLEDRNPPGGVPGSPTQMLQPTGSPLPAWGDFTTYEQMMGVLDSTLALGTEFISAMPSMSVGGLMAIGDAALRKTSGFGNSLGQSGEIAEAGLENIGIPNIPTYSPSTPAGEVHSQFVGDVLQWPMEKLETVSKKYQDWKIENSDNPAEENAGAGGATAIMMLPDLLGVATGIPFKRISNAQKIRRIRKQAEELGLDPGAPFDQQLRQASDAAEAQRADTTAIQDMGPDVAEARRVRRAEISALFEEAKALGATMPQAETAGLFRTMENSVSDMTTSDLPTVQRILDTAEEIATRPGTKFDPSGLETTINELMDLRMSINADLPSDPFSREYRALTKTRRALDNYMQAVFDADMINGSPQAMTKWREGFDQWGEFKDLFDNDRSMVKIWQDSLNPDQVKRLIVNKNAVNANAHAGDLVKDLKSVLGEDHPSIAALQASVMDDIMDPLFKRDTNLKGFEENWRKFKKDNPILKEELFSPDMIAEMDDFAAMAYGIADNMPLAARKEFAVARVVSVLAFGHSMARAAARRLGAERLINYMAAPGREGKVISSALDLGTTTAIFPNTITELSAIETMRPDDEEPEQ